MWKDFRKESTLNWGREIGENQTVLTLTLEEIKLGSLLRIADSLEKMEQPYKDLLETIEYYKKLELENKKLKKTIAGLKGYINKSKGRK